MNLAWTDPASIDLSVPQGREGEGTFAVRDAGEMPERLADGMVSGGEAP